MFWSRKEVYCVAFFICEQTVVRAKPCTVLGICTRIIRKAPQPDVTPYRGEVLPWWVYYVVHTLSKHKSATASYEARTRTLTPS